MEETKETSFQRNEPHEVTHQRNFYDPNDTRHTLIFIHGMGQTQSLQNSISPQRHGNSPYPTSDNDYRSLWGLIKSEWTQQNPGQNFNNFYKPLYVEWLNTTDKEQELLYNLAYGKESKRSMNWIKVAFHFNESASTFFVTKLGDVIAYTDDYNNVIRDTVWSQISAVCAKGKYSIIAHSLGSVVAYDFVLKTQHFTNPNFRHFAPHRNASNDRIIRENFCGLYTFGSPIGIFFLRRFNLFVPRSNPQYLELDYPIVNKTVPWLNFYNPRDPISMPLQGIFASNQQHVPQDIQLKFGLPLFAHTGYWGKRKMAREIAWRL